MMLSPRGLYVDQVKVADLGDVIQQLPVAVVVTIARRDRHGTAGWTALGAIGGLLVGSVILDPIAGGCARDTGCTSGQGLAVVGFGVVLPIVAGFGAWRRSGIIVDDVVYRKR
jgi:hypothetical protein